MTDYKRAWIEACEENRELRKQLHDLSCKLYQWERRLKMLDEERKNIRDEVSTFSDIISGFLRRIGLR